LSNIVYLAEAQDQWFVEGDLERPKHVVVKLLREDAVSNNEEEKAFNPFSTKAENH